MVELNTRICEPGNGQKRRVVKITIAALIAITVIMIALLLAGCVSDSGFLPASGNKMTIGDIGDKIDKFSGTFDKSTQEIKEELNAVSVSQKALVASNKTEYGSGKYLFWAIAAIGILVLLGYLVPVLANRRQVTQLAKQGYIERRNGKT